MNSKVFKYNESKPFAGVLRYLYDRYKSKYLDFIKVNASSEYMGCVATGAIDFNNNIYWHSGNSVIGGYLMIHIPLFLIKLDGYVIQTSSSKIDACHPKEWSMSVSNNSDSFVNEQNEVDENDAMNGPHKYRYISYNPEGLYNSFKISITGSSYCGEAKVDVNQIEFYVTSYSSRFMCASYKYRNRVNSIFLFALIMIS